MSAVDTLDAPLVTIPSMENTSTDADGARDLEADDLGRKKCQNLPHWVTIYFEYSS
jgi:hypothetical protein